MKVQQKGFSAVEAVVVILIVAILCAGGWFAWHSQHKNQQEPTGNSAAARQPQITQKDYTNKDYGFSFKYPSSWTLKEDLEDIGRGTLEGTVTVTAPDGTVVHFDPNLGGKGGSCAPQPSDRPDYTANCSTLRILSNEKTSGSSDDKPVYISKRKITDPISAGSNAHYYLTLSTIDNSLKVNSAIIDSDGIAWPPITLSDTQPRYVNISFTDANGVASRGTSEDYYNSKIVTEVQPILESFKIQ